MDINEWMINIWKSTQKERWNFTAGGRMLAEQAVGADRVLALAALEPQPDLLIDLASAPRGEEHFRAKVRVCTSTTFYRWVFGFTGSIRIEGPEETVEEYREQIRSAAKENGAL